MLFSLMLLVAADSVQVRNIVVAPAETLRTTIVGEGHPVVLIPGFLGSAYGYRKIIPLLSSSGFRVIVVEPLGVGFSSRPGDSDYSLTAQSHRVAAVLDSLGGIRCAPVLAHSHGVSIALRLTIHRPDLVCGIVAENGGAGDTVATVSVRKAARFPVWLIKLVKGRDAARNQIHKGMVETAGDTTWITREVVENYTAGGAGNLNAAMRVIKAMARAKESELLANTLSQVKVPVHVLVGGAPRGSGVSEGMMPMMRAALPQLKVDTIPGAGLRIHEEQAAVVVEAVVDLRKLLGPGSPP